MKPSPPSFPLLIGYAIPKEPVVKGETFYSIKLVLPSTISATGQFFLSTKPDQVTPVVVDDEFVITLGGNELFTKRFSSNCQPVQEETVELPRTLLEQLVGKTSTFSYRDVCGNFVKASTIWLIWRS